MRLFTRFLRISPPTPNVETLVEQALDRLPWDLPKLQEEANNIFNDPVGLMEMRAHYDSLDSHPAWLHFQGLLLGLKEQLQGSLLRGERDKFGNDMTDKIRAAYGVVLQIQAIPETVRKAQRASEEVITGRPAVAFYDDESSL